MNMKRSALVASILAATALSGCGWEESLDIHNLQGTVVLPAAAGTRTLVHEDGSSEEIKDARLIGPVYLGLYASIEPANTVATYPHPEIGPQFLAGVQGDTYPYGGTTIGDLQFACMEFFTCKVVSGRYEDFDAMVDWFTETLGETITDDSGAEVTSGEFVRQTCFDLLEVTTDEEVRLTGDLNFTENADGDFEAPFTIWQQEHFWDQEQNNCTPGEDCTGFSLWGWMDAPSTLSYSFTTCDSSFGYRDTTYDNDFYGGRPQPDALNQPSTYITEGDFVAGEGFVWSNWRDKPRLVLDHEVE